MLSAFVTALMAATAVACLAPPAAWAQASTPVTVRAVVHDLTVELRQVKDGEQDQPNAPGAAYTVGTAHRAVDFVPQQVRVRNGEKASLQVAQSMPMQWVQKIESQSATLSENYLRKLAIDKWDGKMPNAVSGGGTIFSIPTN